MEKSFVGKTLITIGILIIAIGVVSGFFIYDKDIAKNYEIDKVVHEKLSTSTIAQQTYIDSASMHKENVGTTVKVVSSGVIGGLLFVGFGMKTLIRREVYE